MRVVERLVVLTESGVALPGRSNGLYVLRLLIHAGPPRSVAEVEDIRILGFFGDDEKVPVAPEESSAKRFESRSVKFMRTV